MSPTPYIEVFEFKNDWQPAYPAKMWQVIERDSTGDIVNARAVPSKKEAEVLKYQFQQNKS
jgi:hypothetical protein